MDTNQRLTMNGFTLLCMSCLTIMVGAVVAPGMPIISETLGIGNHASLLVTLPALGVVLFAPIAGRLLDKFGAYYCTLVALFLYGAIGVSGQWFYGPAAVYTNRILLGAATAVLMAGGTTLIAQFYYGYERLVMIARQGMAIELGGVVFLFLGGILAVNAWNQPFLLYLVAWVFMAMMLLYVPKDNPEQAQPVAKSDTSSSQSLVWIYISACVAMTLFFSAYVVLPMSMKEAGYDADKVGMFLAFISLVAVATAYFLPKIIVRWKEKGALSLSYGLYAVSHVAFYFGASLPVLLLGGVFAGIAFGLSIPLFNHITVEHSKVGFRGKNLSYLAMANFLGQFLTSFFELLSGDLHVVYFVAAVASIVYFVVVQFVFSEKKKQSNHTAKIA